MPANYIDTVDDQLAYDSQAGFAGGQVSFLRATELGPQQAWTLEDLDIEVNGTIRTRMGWHALGDLATLAGAVAMQGAWWFDTPTWEGILAVAGGKLYRCPVGGTWVKVADSAVNSSTLPAYAAQVADYIFISTGDSRPKYWAAATIAAGGAGTLVKDGPATCGHLIAQNFRIFARNEALPDEVYCTGYLPSSDTPFGSIAPFRIGAGEGDHITALQPWKGWNLIAFKGQSVWAVNTEPLGVDGVTTITSEFSIIRISSKVGCIAHRSAVPVGNDLYFLARDGVRSLAKTQEDGEGTVSLALSEPIRDWIERINMAYVDLSCATWWRGRYLLAVPIDSSTVPNVVLVQNLQTGGWQVWQGLQPVQFVVTAFNSQQERAALLDARRQLMVFRDHVAPSNRVVTDYADTLDGVTFTRPSWLMRSRSMGFGDLLAPKVPERIEITFDSSEATADVSVIVDDDHYSPYPVKTREATGSPGLIVPFVLPATLGQSRQRHIPYDITAVPECRSLAVEVHESRDLTATEAAASGPVGISRITAAAYQGALGT